VNARWRKGCGWHLRTAEKFRADGNWLSAAREYRKAALCAPDEEARKEITQHETVMLTYACRNAQAHGWLGQSRRRSG